MGTYPVESHHAHEAWPRVAGLTDRPEPHPSRAISAAYRSIMSPLSARVGDEPKDSTTDGCVFRAKKGARSTSVNGRRMSRGVVMTVVAVPQSPEPRP